MTPRTLAAALPLFLAAPALGQDETPPRVISVDPSPALGYADQVGLTEIRVGFDEAVTLPAGAATVFTVAGGPIADVKTSFDLGTNTLTIALPAPVHSDRLTLVLDHAITDMAGNPLDGEIEDPANAVLPSGDDLPGGQAVFRINALQGDANGDGVVDGDDAPIIVNALGWCDGEGGYDARADLNRDGCVNVLDVSIYQSGFGLVLPATDGQGPSITARDPEANASIRALSFDTVVVELDEAIDSVTVTPSSLFAVRPDGTMQAADAVVLGAGDSGLTFTFDPPLDQGGVHRLQLSNGVADPSGELLSVESSRAWAMALDFSPATIVATSPGHGAVDVALTRETVVHFDFPVDPRDITADAFYATFGGETLPAMLHVSPDATSVTLFYQEPLPPSALVRVHVVGDGLFDEFGNVVDADADGEPGGTAEIDFDTVTLTTLPGTRVCGRVFASELNDGGMNEPLENVLITVDGAADTLFAMTDDKGNFCLDPAPVGTFFVHVDGKQASNPSTPEGAYYPNVGKPWTSIAGQEVNVGNVYLPLVIDGTLQDVSDVDDVTIPFPKEIIDGNPDLAGVEITVPAGSLFANDGTTGGQAGIAPVAPDRLPGTLPEGFDFPLVITVQVAPPEEGGMPPTNFDVPAPVVFPNLPLPDTGEPLAPGATRFLFSFNHDAGKWEAIGPMTVSEDGAFIVSDPGVGILAPGWHGAGPPPSTPPLPCPGCCGGAGSGGGSGGGDGGGGGPGPPLAEGGCGPCKNPGEAAARQADCEARVSKMAGKFAARCTVILGLMGTGVGDAVGDPGDLYEFLGIWGLGPGVDCLAAAGSFTERWQRVCCQANSCNGPGDCGGDPLAGAIDPLEEFIQGDPIAAAIVADIDAAIQLLAPFVIKGELPPDEILEQIEQLMAHANDVAGGDAIAYLRAIEVELEADIAELDLIFGDEAPGAAPANPMHFRAVALRDTPDGLDATVFTGMTGPSAQYSLFLPADTRAAAVVFFDPVGNQLGWVGDNVRPDAPFRFPRATVLPLEEFGDLADSDDDGLVDRVESILGTDPADPDTDGDGISDGAEIEQGTDPLDGLIVQTGIIATADTPGLAPDIDVIDSLAYVADGQGGVAVFNVFNGMDPTIIAQVDTPGNAAAVAASGNLVAVADGLGGLAIVDVTDPPSAAIVHTVGTADLAGSARCVEVTGDIAWVGTNYGDVVSVQMATGAIIQRLEVGGDVNDIVVTGEHLYALTADTLHVCSYTGALDVVGSAPAPGLVNENHGRKRLFVADGLAWAVHMSGYALIDVSDAASPQLLPMGDTAQFGWKHIALNGSGLGIATVGANSSFDGPHHVSLYDLQDPTNPDIPIEDRFITTFETPGVARAVSIFNGLAYVADHDAGLQVINYLPYDANGVAPTVTFGTTAEGGVIVESSLLRIDVSVEDDVQVRRVELLVDGAVVQTDGNYPFEFFLRMPEYVGLTLGIDTLALSVRASDTGGNVGEADEQVVVIIEDLFPPTVLSSSPANGSQVIQGVFAAGSISAVFSESIDPGSIVDAVDLRAAGDDGVIGTRDDVLVAFDATLVGAGFQLVVTVPNDVPVGPMRLTLDAALVTDLAGNGLDGDGDGTPGDDFELEFEVLPSKGVFWVVDADGSWHDGANWSTGAPPEDGDDVLMIVPGERTILYSTGVTTVFRVQSAETFAMTGGTFGSIVASTFDGPLLLQAGMLTGTDLMFANDVFDWTGGSLSGSGRTIAAQGVSISGPNGTRQMSGNRVLELHGASTITASGQAVTILSGTANEIAITPGATLAWLSDSALVRVAGSELTVTNEGTLTRNGAGAATFAAGVSYVSPGATDVLSGALVLDEDGEISGPVTIAGGAQLRVDHDYAFTASPPVSGAGDLVLDSGLLTLLQPVTLDGVTLAHSGGSLAGSVTTNTPIDWVAGTQSGPGTTTALDGIAFSGSNLQRVIDADRVLELHATSTITSDGQALTTTGGAANVVHVNPGATLEWLSAGSIVGTGGTQTTLTNDGAVQVATAGTATIGLNVTYVAAGLTDVQSGTLLLDSPGTISGPVAIAGAAQVTVDTDFTFAGSPDVTGAGTLQLTSGTLNCQDPLSLTGVALLQTGGTMTGAIGSTGAITWQAGTLGSGTTTALGGMTISGASGTSVINGNRVIDLHGASTITASGQAITATGGASAINIHRGATLEWLSDGTIVTISSTIAITNDGTLVRNGGGDATISTSVDFQNNGVTEVVAGNLRIGFTGANAGTIDIRSAGNVTINPGSTFVLDSNGSVVIHLAGTALHGDLDIDSSTPLAGTFEVVADAGYEPQVGDTFDVVTFSGGSSFDAIEGLDLGGGLVLEPVYLADRLRLTVVAKGKAGE